MWVKQAWIAQVLAAVLVLLTAAVNAQTDHMFRLVEGGPFNDHLQKLTTEFVVGVDPESRLSFDLELVKIRMNVELSSDDLLVLMNEALPVTFGISALTPTGAPAIRSGNDPDEPSEIKK